MNLRDEVLTAQRNLKTLPWTNTNLPLKVESLKRTAGRPLGERFAVIGADQLAAVRFIHTAEEPLIGRVAPWNITPEERNAAKEALKDQPASPGQTGHCEPYYEEVFRVGLDGLRERAVAAGMISFGMAAEGVSVMIEHAAEQAVREDVAVACRHIAHRPPRTFHEAIQLLWFICFAIQVGDRAALVGPGRLDRRLIRFYEADVAASRLTREAAREMIETLYLFINDLCRRGFAYAVMVGGGKSCNELSFLVLEALRKTRLVYPSIGVCWGPDTPEELRELAVDLIAEGFSNVAIFNDELIRNSLIRYGVPADEAGDYINSACVEITPSGAGNVYVGSPYFPLCTILLEYMESAEPESFEAFRNGYLRLLGDRIRTAAEQQNQFRRQREAGTRRPIQSLFTRDCIGRKRDIEEGGALYNWVECSFVGLANLVDSLCVIRREVYEDSRMTLRELREILRSDFAGAESVRQRFLHGHPKYGNADPAVDEEIPIIVRFIEEQCAAQKMYPGESWFIPGTFCFETHHILGRQCGATPDGRHAGMPFADGAGPAQGREEHGPTAAVRSVCSWDHSSMLGGSAFNQRYTAATVASPEARKKLETLIDIFIRSGGFETQINILDAETLTRAQRHPEEYRDQVVRIGGYTDYFTGLNPAMQAELIRRTLYHEI